MMPAKNGERNRPTQKTWAAFKTFFTTEYHDLKEQQRINVTQTNLHGANAGIHSANATINIGQALDNLALAATTNKDIVAQLTATIKTLTTQLQKALDTNVTLIQKLGTTITTPTTQLIDRHTGRPCLSRVEYEANLDPNIPLQY
jgi:hypothetical protein